MRIAVQGSAIHVSTDSREMFRDGGPVSDEAPKVLLGRKGLGAKEPATQLALCAVHRALGRAPRELGLDHLSPRTAVVAASNFGNAETICTIAADVAQGGMRAASPMAAPNASSNIVASTIALRYGFTGPNIMVCNGSTSGLDAVRIGSRLLRAGRASRVVVVGVEPDDPITLRSAGSLTVGAACVVLGESLTGTEPILGKVRALTSPPDGYDDDASAAAGITELVRASKAHAPVSPVVCGSAAGGWLSVDLIPAHSPSPTPQHHQTA